MGPLAITAVRGRDYPMIMAINLIIASHDPAQQPRWPTSSTRSSIPGSSTRDDGREDSGLERSSMSGAVESIGSADAQASAATGRLGREVSSPGGRLATIPPSPPGADRRGHSRWS